MRRRGLFAALAGLLAAPLATAPAMGRVTVSIDLSGLPAGAGVPPVQSVPEVPQGCLDTLARANERILAWWRPIDQRINEIRRELADLRESINRPDCRRDEGEAP